MPSVSEIEVHQFPTLSLYSCKSLYLIRSEIFNFTVIVTEIKVSHLWTLSTLPQDPLYLVLSFHSTTPECVICYQRERSPYELYLFIGSPELYPFIGSPEGLKDGKFVLKDFR